MFGDEMFIARSRMVERLRQHYKIQDEKVLMAMNTVPRHLFVPEALQSNAYGDHALPISANQTISQPFIVARMTELLEVGANSKVLEIGAGSGYQSAVLAQIVHAVFGVERIPELFEEAKKRLQSLNVRRVSLRLDDGTRGWEMYAPYDAILVAAGSPEIPLPLLNQLKIGGKLILPIGDSRDAQKLLRVKRKSETEFSKEDFGSCLFVPLIGEHGWKN